MIKSGLALIFGIVCAVPYGAAQPAAADDLFRLVRANDLDGLQRLAAHPNVANGIGETPLHYAATFGSVESVRILLDHGADPNARNRAGATPLVSAAYDLEKTRLLVEKGADVNAHAANGITPLMVAASVHGNVATLRYLLDKGADAKAV